MEEPAYKTKKDKRAEENRASVVKLTEAGKIKRTQQAMQMRIDGHDYPEIVEVLGYGSVREAADDVHEALEEEFLNNAQLAPEIMRMIEIKRLNTLYQALLPGVRRGSARSADVAVKVSDRISKMTGLDAAVKTQLEVVEMGRVGAEIEKLKAEIASRQAARGELEAPVYDVEIVEES